MKIKLSWTILNTWAKGDHAGAIKTLMGLGIPENEAMREGKQMHEAISTNKLKLLDFMPDNCIFEKVAPEKNDWTNYFHADINEWLTLSMVADVIFPLPNKTWGVIDWKSGRQKSSEVSKMQVYLYGLIMDRMKYPKTVTEGYIAHIDKDGNGGIYCNDYSTYIINAEKIELAENYAITIGSEIFDYIQNHQAKLKTE